MSMFILLFVYYVVNGASAGAISNLRFQWRRRMMKWIGEVIMMMQLTEWDKRKLS